MAFGIISYTSAFFQWDERYCMLGDELLGLSYLMSSDYNPCYSSPTRKILDGINGLIIFFKTPDKELKFNKLVYRYYEALRNYYENVTIGCNSFGIIFIDGTTSKKREKVLKADMALAEFLESNMHFFEHDFSDIKRTETNFKLIPFFNELIWKNTNIQ